MTSKLVHPYGNPGQVSGIVDRVHQGVSPRVHPQEILHGLRREEASINRANGWLADHIVGLTGTMGLFYLLCMLISGWSLWQGDRT